MVARYFQMLPSNAKNKSVAMMATAAPEKIKRSIARTFEKIRSISNHMNIRRSRTERLLYQGAGSTMASVVAFIGPESQSQTDAGFDRVRGARTAMEPAKPRKWTEEETKLLIELAQRKERVPAMAREIGRHVASVRRRALELGLPLPPGRGERQL